MMEAIWEQTRDGRWSTIGQTTIPRLLDEAAENWGGRTFLDFSGEKYSFAETNRRVTQLAHGLQALGIGAGDRVASLLENVSDCLFVWFAVNRLGAVWMPINIDFKGEFLRHQLADSGAKLIVSESKYAERVFGIEERLPELGTLVFRGERPEAATRLSLHDIGAVFSGNDMPIADRCGPRDLALLIYTSGTTGPSKGCMMSHSYACNYAATMAWSNMLTEEDVFWTPCPLFHAAATGGVVLPCLRAGAAVSIAPRFSVSNFWPEIERSGATRVLLLSIMLSLVPDAPDTEVSKRCHGQIKSVIGAPLPGSLRKKWKERFGVQYAVSPAYANTEANVMTVTRIDDPDLPDNASGRRYQDFDLRIIGDDGNECPPNTPGEIVVRPTRPGIMFDGYWGRPEATVAAFKDLWFHTGDMGMLDENDYFYFVDRKKDYLRRGGENISSFEVETTFLNHPAVAEVAAHSVFSELSEDELKVTIVLRQGAELCEEDLCRWAVGQLPRFAVPRFIEFRSALPRTPTGRIQKFELRADGVTPATWDRQASDIVPEKRA
jgi:crotonobetaine/carnitine-CoA ligase